MRGEIEKLRDIMDKKGLAAWLVPSSDAHQSEYIGEHDRSLKYLSGFGGSAGTLLVFKDKAYLWTDGRYFVQAERELEGSGIELMKMGEPGVPEINEMILNELKSGETLGFYGRLIDSGQGSRLCRLLNQRGIELKTDEDICSCIWDNRPERSANPVWLHDISYCGESVSDKLLRVRALIEKKKADMLLLSSLSDIAWLTNMRGSDISCNPLFLSYMAIGMENAYIFIQKEALCREAIAFFGQNSIEIMEYDSWTDFTKGLENLNILIDAQEIDYLSFTDIKSKNKIINSSCNIASMKSVKNKTELENMRKSHIRDGIYMVRFIRWLKASLNAGDRLTEKSASDYLDALRSSDDKFVDLSFATISAYGANAAMPHYEADENGGEELLKRGLYLVDSGAHYLDGTTDVTRTFALGETSDEERVHYTLCVIGMLRLLNAVFPEGIRGYNLDTYARELMWKYGLDFKHGTGHGVGFCNTVHESPVAIRPRPSVIAARDAVFEEGMVCSDEPGIYIAGSHGIRMEILIAARKREDGFLCFEPLTFVPADGSIIVKEMLDKEDIKNYNSYQNKVYEKLSPYLGDEEKEWLKKECAPI